MSFHTVHLYKRVFSKAEFSPAFKWQPVNIDVRNLTERDAFDEVTSYLGRVSRDFAKSKYNVKFREIRDRSYNLIGYERCSDDRTNLNPSVQSAKLFLAAYILSFLHSSFRGQRIIDCLGSSTIYLENGSDVRRDFGDAFVHGNAAAWISANAARVLVDMYSDKVILTTDSGFWTCLNNLVNQMCNLSDIKENEMVTPVQLAVASFSYSVARLNDFIGDPTNNVKRVLDTRLINFESVDLPRYLSYENRDVLEKIASLMLKEQYHRRMEDTFKVAFSEAFKFNHKTMTLTFAEDLLTKFTVEFGINFVEQMAEYALITARFTSFFTRLPNYLKYVMADCEMHSKEIPSAVLAVIPLMFDFSNTEDSGQLFASLTGLSEDLISTTLANNAVKFNPVIEILNKILDMYYERADSSILNGFSACYVFDNGRKLITRLSYAKPSQLSERVISVCGDKNYIHNLTDKQVVPTRIDYQHVKFEKIPQAANLAGGSKSLVDSQTGTIISGVDFTDIARYVKSWCTIFETIHDETNQSFSCIVDRKAVTIKPPRTAADTISFGSNSTKRRDNLSTIYTVDKIDIDACIDQGNFLDILMAYPARLVDNASDETLAGLYMHRVQQFITEYNEIEKVRYPDPLFIKNPVMSLLSMVSKSATPIFSELYQSAASMPANMKLADVTTFRLPEAYVIDRYSTLYLPIKSWFLNKGIFRTIARYGYFRGPLNSKGEPIFIIWDPNSLDKAQTLGFTPTSAQLKANDLVTEDKTCFLMQLNFDAYNYAKGAKSVSRFKDGATSKVRFNIQYPDPAIQDCVKDPTCLYDYDSAHGLRKHFRRSSIFSFYKPDSDYVSLAFDYCKGLVTSAYLVTTKVYAQFQEQYGIVDFNVVKSELDTLISYLEANYAGDTNIGLLYQGGSGTVSEISKSVKALDKDKPESILNLLGYFTVMDIGKMSEVTLLSIDVIDTMNDGVCRDILNGRSEYIEAPIGVRSVKIPGFDTTFTPEIEEILNAVITSALQINLWQGDLTEATEKSPSDSLTEDIPSDAVTLKFGDLKKDGKGIVWAKDENPEFLVRNSTGFTVAAPSTFKDQLGSHGVVGIKVNQGYTLTFSDKCPRDATPIVINDQVCAYIKTTPEKRGTIIQSLNAIVNYYIQSDNS